MSFLITKLLLYLMLPPASPAILILAGAALIGRHRCIGRALLFFGVAALYLLSIEPVAGRLIMPLEAAYPQFRQDTLRADAVVALGGGVRDLTWIPAAAEPSDASLERTVAAVFFAKKFRLPLILAGGRDEFSLSKPRESEAMAAVAEGMGVPRRMIVLDRTSHNTLENAAAVRSLISGRRILLVTSASHMKRAAAMFSKAGFTVIPAPCGYRARSRAHTPLNYIPRADHLETSSLALAEYISLTWYGLRGKL